MNTELARIWKEDVLVQFRVLSGHLPGGTGENRAKLQSGSSEFGPRFQAGPNGYRTFPRNVSILRLVYTESVHCREPQTSAKPVYAVQKPKNYCAKCKRRIMSCRTSGRPHLNIQTFISREIATDGVNISNRTRGPTLRNETAHLKY